ncbi:calcium/sodium antiporter [Galenea microaerophila]
MTNGTFMTELILPAIGLVIGLFLLVKSSDYFIEGAASTAVHLNIAPLIIGVVVLGFGTSAPEIIVSILASLDGSPGLAIGNVVGSNIANIGLVLGSAALIAPIAVKSSILKHELPLLLLISTASILLIIDDDLDRIDGIILLITLVGTMFWMVKTNSSPQAKSDPMEQEIEQELNEIPKLTLRQSITYLLLGLIVLMLSAKMMVWGAVEIAHFFGVSETIIGLTIIAIGTSLPELAASITAARKNEADLMIGNILGSNLFNLLAVMAMPALIAPGKINDSILLLDYPIMLALTLVMLLVAIPRKNLAVITRIEGAILLASYIAYLLFLYYRTVSA